MQRYTAYFIWKVLYMFRVLLPPIIRSAYNCICNIWYLSHHYCYLPLSWRSWNCRANTRWCRYSCMRSWWWVELPPETCRAVSRQNKLRNVASCWIHIRICILVIRISLWRWPDYRPKHVGENILNKIYYNNSSAFVGYLYIYFVPCCTLHVSCNAVLNPSLERKVPSAQK